MSDRDTVESAYLKARARFLVWQQEIQAAWSQGDANAALSVLENKLNQLPPEIKARSQANNPEAWAALQQRVKNPQKANGGNVP